MAKGKRITTKQVQAAENKPFTLPEIQHKPEPDEDGWDSEGLTPKQLMFVENLVGPAGGNATKAAELAGYRSDNRNALAVTASENLRKPKVREAIARRLARFNLTADWVQQMTAALAASNMGTFLSLNAEGKPEIPWREAESLGAFVQIRKYREKGIEVGGTQVVTERTIETHNPAPYLVLLAKMLGLVKDTPAGASVTVNVHQMSENDLVRIATRGGDGTAEKASGEAVADRLRQRD